MKSYNIMAEQAIEQGRESSHRTGVIPTTEEDRRKRAIINTFVRLAINEIPKLNQQERINLDDINCVTFFQFLVTQMEVTNYYRMRVLTNEPTHMLSSLSGLSQTAVLDPTDQALRTGERGFYVFRSTDLDGLKAAVEAHGSGLLLFFGRPYSQPEAEARGENEISLVSNGMRYFTSHVTFVISPEYLQLILEDPQSRTSFQAGQTTATEIGYPPAREDGFSLLQAHIGEEKASIDDLDGYMRVYEKARPWVIFIPSEQLVAPSSVAQR
jgi:hypothetical protein